MCTVALGIGNVYLGYQTSQLDNQLHNYPTRVFGFANEWLVLNTGKPLPNGHGNVTVVIVSPDEGYFSLTRAGFYPSDAAFLDRRLLQNDDVELMGTYVFPVKSGVTSTSVNLSVFGRAAVNSTFAPIGHLGTLVLEITFHDVQRDRDYSNSTSVEVLLVG